MREMTELLNQNHVSGPYFLGDTVSYTDFIWGAILLFFKAVREDDVYEELLARSGEAEVHRRFLKALSPWTERND